MDTYIERMLGPQNKEVQHQQVVNKIRALLDRLPEVEKASGSLSLKLKGHPLKTLTFKYK